jgi:hypothetical protein
MFSALSVFGRRIKGMSGPGSSVGIVTDYGLDGPGIESRWGWGFSYSSTPALGPTHLLYNGYRVYPGGKATGTWCRPHHILLVPRLKIVELYLYSPSRPHKPVVGWPLPLSKGWYGFGLSMPGRATWHVTTVRSSRLLYIHDAFTSRNKLGTPWCNARRVLLRHEAWDDSSDRNSVSCRSLATLRRYGTR